MSTQLKTEQSPGFGTNGNAAGISPQQYTNLGSVNCTIARRVSGSGERRWREPHARKRDHKEKKEEQQTHQLASA
jgi:hypothetical protein